jgi:hypothetical protein
MRGFPAQNAGCAERREALPSLEAALLRQKDQILAAISDDFGGRAAEETLALELFSTQCTGGRKSRDAQAVGICAANRGVIAVDCRGTVFD